MYITYLRSALFHLVHVRWVGRDLCCLGYHFIILLVTGKNKYEINALMKKASYNNI